MRKSFSLLLFITLLNILYHLFFSYDKEIENTLIVIKRGMKISEISDMLHNKGIINNEFAFKIWVKLNFLEKNIKYGEFEIRGKNSIFNVTKNLSSGKFFYRKFTLVEGMYKYELFKFLKKIDPYSELQINDIPENLIADTYNYVVTDSAERVLENILSHSKRLSEIIWSKRDKNIPLKNINEMHILASIVEKEATLKSEKNKIAGVFFNRIKIGMRLQSDPTVEFSITKGKEKLGRKLLRKDLKFVSEYNTYMNKGLPPSVICYRERITYCSISAL